MKITELKLRGVTVFEAVDFSFVPGVNVIIGDNGTGKSHLLKVLYAMLEATPDRRVSEEEMDRGYGEMLAEVLKPAEGEVGRLVRLGKEDATIDMVTDVGSTRLRFSSAGDVSVETASSGPAPEVVFLPARDVLAMFEGFLPLYEERKISFDRTYRDLCLALQKDELRSLPRTMDEAVARPLGEMLGGQVSLRGNRFYVDFGAGEHEAHLVAEGLRKIATLVQLVRNGSIAEGGVLLWDEPETNMNPRLLAKVADLLLSLARAGVQVIVATHDYLFSHRLSFAAEYKTHPDVPICFFSLFHEHRTDPVGVQVATSLVGIRENAILDEYAELDAFERGLYQAELERDSVGGRR